MTRYCPFCQQELYDCGVRILHNGINNYGGRKYVCTSTDCMVNNDFPRYLDVRDDKENIVAREYALGKFYIKVNNDVSYIYKLVSCMIEGEIKIARAFWLNPRNLDETLDKLRLCVTFS